MIFWFGQYKQGMEIQGKREPSLDREKGCLEFRVRMWEDRAGRRRLLIPRRGLMAAQKRSQFSTQWKWNKTEKGLQ